MFLSLSLLLCQAMNPVIASAIVPGWGETILGRKNEARAFFVIEGSLWTSYLGFNYFGHKALLSSKAFAVDHARANAGQSAQDYFDALEDFDNSDDYNLEIEREASFYFPDDPVRQQQYIQEHSYVNSDAWKWDTLTNRVEYWQRRKAAREDLRRASFVSGFLIINRIVSIVNVTAFSSSEKFGLDTEPGRIGFYIKF